MADFAPAWASNPGVTISRLLNASHLGIREFCDQLELSRDAGAALISGQLEVDKTIALKLSKVLGSSPTYWLNKERQYREDLERMMVSDESKHWMESLPLSDMVKYRWIDPHLRGSSKLKACLDYFDVRSSNDWDRKYRNLLSQVAFRTSDSFDSTPQAVITWLRQAEKQCEELECEDWDAEAFRAAVQHARNLTTEKDPSVFLPKLRRLFSKCGVALAIAPTPKGCHASGAVYFSSETKAVMILSFRYLSDDHFWFSLFHECGHLLLHRDEGLILELSKKNKSRIEEEADRFSSELLIPAEYEEELLGLGRGQLRKIYKFAKKLRLSPGIVVGQLQYRGVIDHRYLNKAKVRYQWR